MEAVREKLVVSVVLALTFACRLDQLVNAPRPAALGVSPSQVAESALVGSVLVRDVALAVSSARADALSWTAYREAGAAWLTLNDSTGAAPDTLRLSLDPSLLPPGTYRDVVILVPDELAVARVRVPVELRIAPAP